jgi:hypothetical protein
MSSSTRRGFLALSATGVATGAAVVVTPSALAADTEAAGNASTASGPFVAYVHDAARGEVTIMRGEREVVVRDPALVRRLGKHL